MYTTWTLNWYSTMYLPLFLKLVCHSSHLSRGFTISTGLWTAVIFLVTIRKGLKATVISGNASQKMLHAHCDAIYRLFLSLYNPRKKEITSFVLTTLSEISVSKMALSELGGDQHFCVLVWPDRLQPADHCLTFSAYMTRLGSLLWNHELIMHSWKKKKTCKLFM